MIKKNIVYDEFASEIMEKLKKEEEIGSNPRYINWLERFTEKYPRFTDDDFLYNKKIKSAEDIEGIKCLNMLYNVVEQYAQKNYIYLTKNSEYSGSYQIKYNDIGYEIGCMVGQGTLFYCGRVNNPDNTFIDFNDILLNKKQPYTDKFNMMLEKLTTIVAFYHEQGIPIEALQRSLNEVIKSMYDETKRKDKQLKKVL